MHVWPPNGGTHLPAPGLQTRRSEQAHQRMEIATKQRSADGAVQVQRVLAIAFLCAFT
jgi:hypothetical protein